MPKKKADAQRAKARELYEQEGLSLASISEELEINYSTVKSWKSRDKWVKSASAPSVASKKGKRRDRSQKKRRKVSENSLKNLQPAPKFEKGNQAALKHGFYAKHLPPWVNEILDSMDSEEDELEKLKSIIEVHYALYIGAVDKVDLKKGGLKVLNEAAAKLGTLISQYKTLKSKIGTTTEDDEFIEALERSIPMIWGEDNE